MKWLILFCAFSVSAQVARLPLPIVSSKKQSAAGTGLKTGLTVYLKNEEATSANRLDASGNSHTFTCVNTVDSITGKSGNGSWGAHGNPGGLMKNTESALRTTTSQSMSLWVNPTSMSGNANAAVVSQWGATHKWILIEDPGATTLRFGIRNNADDDTTYALSTITMSDGTWYHVACGFDSVAQKVWIQINGETRVQSTYTQTPNSTSEDFAIADFSSALDIGWTGYFDEIAFWAGRSITTTEVGLIYNSGTGLFYDAW